MARPRRGSRSGLDQLMIEIQGRKRDWNRRQAHRSQYLDGGPRAEDFRPARAASRRSGSRAGPGQAGMIEIEGCKRDWNRRQAHRCQSLDCKPRAGDFRPAWAASRRGGSRASPGQAEMIETQGCKRDWNRRQPHCCQFLDRGSRAGDFRPARAASRRSGSRAGPGQAGIVLASAVAHLQRSKRHPTG